MTTQTSVTQNSRYQQVPISKHIIQQAHDLQQATIEFNKVKNKLEVQIESFRVISEKFHEVKEILKSKPDIINKANSVMDKIGYSFEEFLNQCAQYILLIENKIESASDYLKQDKIISTTKSVEKINQITQIFNASSEYIARALEEIELQLQTFNQIKHLLDLELMYLNKLSSNFIFVLININLDLYNKYSSQGNIKNYMSKMYELLKKAANETLSHEDRFNLLVTIKEQAQMWLQNLSEESAPDVIEFLNLIISQLHDVKLYKNFFIVQQAQVDLRDVAISAIDNNSYTSILESVALISNALNNDINNAIQT